VCGRPDFYTGAMKLLLAGLAAALVAPISASAAAARWSAPQAVTAPSANDPAAAVNVHGEAAVAWTTAGRGRTSVYVAVRSQGGRLRRHRVWSGRRWQATDVSVVIDARRRVTVAWAATRAGAERQTVRYAYTTSGRWARARVVGHAAIQESLPPDRFPRLAVARRGDVLLAWDQADGPRVAWRLLGHRFGKPRRLTGAPRGPIGPIPAFDAGGSAYVSGKCTGIVFRTRPGRRSFGRPTAVAPGRALGFTLALAGRGQGLAGWIGGACTTSAGEGDAPGLVLASILRDGTFQKPLSLSPAGTLASRAAVVADPNGGIVSWGDPQRGVFSAVVRRAGLLESARQITDSVVPVAADGGGDQVFVRALDFPPPALPPVLFVRPFGGGADDPAPSATGEYAVSAPTGRAVVLAWPGTGQVNLSVWRP
jgi:hypothetical protein